MIPMLRWMVVQCTPQVHTQAYTTVNLQITQPNMTVEVSTGMVDPVPNIILLSAVYSQTMSLMLKVQKHLQEPLLVVELSTGLKADHTVLSEIPSSTTIPSNPIRKLTVELFYGIRVPTV